MQSEIEAALNFDPLAEAERITGESYKTDESTDKLGLGLHLMHGQIKSDLLSAAGDTHWGQALPDWIAVVEGLGFRLVHIEDIPESDDKYRIWWRDDGLLLRADSYWGDKSVNSANVAFNYCGPRDAMHRCSSGFAGEVDGKEVWRGDRDCREGMKFAIERMEAQGRFLNPWIEPGFIWLLHYQDSKVPGYDYRAINSARLAALPDHVRAAIPA